MTAKKMTAIFIGVCVVVIGAYDVYAILVGGKEASISWTLVEWSYDYPSIPFLSGFLCGHLFWRMKDPKDTK